MKNALLFLLLSYGFQSTAQTAELKPTEDQALLEVIVENGDKKPLEGEKVSFVATKGGKIYGGITNAAGRFKILVPEGDKYQVKYKNFTEEKEYKALDIPSQPGLIDFEFTIHVNRPKVYTLDKVFFDSGKSTLRTESNKALDDLSEFMKNKKTMKIEIAGHTDNVGDKAVNEKLSQERASAVRNYLLKKGIAADRVVAKGYGDTQPIESNETAEGKQKNRRTEVRTISE
jgi:OOP family OmpA-OmpF porin